MGHSSLMTICAASCFFSLTTSGARKFGRIGVPSDGRATTTQQVISSFDVAATRRRSSGDSGYSIASSSARSTGNANCGSSRLCREKNGLAPATGSRAYLRNDSKPSSGATKHRTLSFAISMTPNCRVL